MRGQSLVLACLYMLLLVVMVLMTLGISQRVREKIELNTLAESTAYSNAVATARAYNAVSLMNRAAIAHWINLAGVESLISWTGLFFAEYYAMLEGLVPTSAFTYYDTLSPPTVNGLPGYSASSDCEMAMANVLWNPFNELYNNDLKIDWLQFINDAARAGQQGRRLQDAIGSLKGAEVAVVDSARTIVTGNQLGAEISQLAQQPDLSTSVGGVSAPNAMWMSAAQPGLDSDKMWWAVMDARSPWVKNRSNDPISRLERALKRAYDKIFASPPYALIDVLTRQPFGQLKVEGSVTFDFTSHGHGCFGSDFPTCEAGPDWTNALAQDLAHGVAHINITRIKGTIKGGRSVNCPGYTRTVSMDNESRVKASDSFHDDDYAWWDYKKYGGSSSSGGTTSPVMSQVDQVAYTEHTMGPCTDNYLLRPCHSVYVPIVGLDQSHPLEGQAKNYAGLSRDHSRHASGSKDPWDVKMSFGFGGTPASIDLAKGADEPAVSVGTGIAYYHRRGHFTEMPNLFNPYWRATLIGAQRGSDDLGGLPGTAGAAWAALKAAGYRGEN
jgi:hypothetical protein